MNMDKFYKENPNKVELLDDAECYYALINDTVTTHDGYSEREGGGFSSSPWIKIVRLGTREEALAWLRTEEKSKELQWHTPKAFKIVLMKPIQVNKTIALDI